MSSPEKLIRDDGQRRSGAMDLAQLIDEVNTRRRRWLFAKTSSIDFALGDAATASYEALCNASEALSQSIHAERYTRSEHVLGTNERKQNAGAKWKIGTSVVTFERSLPHAIRSNVRPWGIREGGWGMYFFPTLIVVDDGREFVAFEYQQVRVTAATSVRVASSHSPLAPGDAVVVGQTWEYSKIGGGRDRRKKNNIQLDEYQVVDIEIALPASGALRFAFSRAAGAEEWVTTYDRHRRVLASGGATRAGESLARQIAAGLLAGVLDGNAQRDRSGTVRDQLVS